MGLKKENKMVKIRVDTEGMATNRVFINVDSLRPSSFVATRESASE